MRFRFEEFQLDTESGELLRDGAAVPLRRQTFRLLQVLVERAPALLDRDTLLDEVWGHQALSPNVLPQAISELRQSLGESAQSPRFIETRHRRGYRFCAQVTAEAPRPQESMPVAIAETPLDRFTDAARRNPPPAEPAAPPIRVAPRPALLLLAAALLLALLLLWPRSEAPPTSTTTAAVLALGAFNQEPGLPNWIATAGLELLTAQLSRQPRLHLLRSDALDPLGGPADVRWQHRMHELLGAPLALGGHWHDAGAGRVGLDLSLIDLASGRILLTHSDSAPFEALDLLLERAAADLLTALRLPQSASGRGVERPDAASRLTYWEALEDLARGKGEAALAQLKQLHAQLDTPHWLVPALVRAYRETGQFEPAAALIARRLEDLQMLPLGESLRLQAELGQLQHRPETAAAALRALVELFPEDLESQLRLAEMQLDALQGEAARATIGQLGRQARAARDPRFLLLSARAARLDGQYKSAHGKAQEALDAALRHQLSGLAAIAVLSRAETFKTEGDLAAADALLLAFLGESGEQLGAMQRGQLTLQRLALLREQGRHDAAQALLDELIREGFPESLAARLGVEAALLQVAVDRPDQAGEWLARVAASSSALDEPGLRIAWNNAEALRALADGDIDTARAAFDAAFSLATRSGRAGQSVALQVNAGLMLARQRRFEEAESLWLQALAVFEQLGDRRGQATCLGNLAAAASATGRVERGEELNQRALALFRELRLPGPLARTAYNLGLSAMRAGDLTLAEGLFEEALQGWRSEGQADLVLQAAASRAEVLLLAGDLDAAERQLDGVEPEMQLAGALRRSHVLAASASHALLLGRMESARDFESTALALRREAGHAGWIALSELHLLRLDLLSGGSALQVQLQAEALAARFAALGELRDQARAQLLITEALLAQSRVDSANQALDAARLLAGSFKDTSLELQLDWISAWASPDQERPLRLRALQERADAIGHLPSAWLARRSLELPNAPASGALASTSESAPGDVPLPPYARWPAGSEPGIGQLNR